MSGATEFEATREGDAFVYLWHALGYAIGFDCLNDDRYGLRGEIHIRTVQIAAATGRNGHVYQSRFNLSDGPERDKLAKMLTPKNDRVPWRDLLEIACVETLGQYRRGSPVVDLAQTRPVPQRYLDAHGMIPIGETSVFYGDGACVAAGTLIEGPDGAQPIEVLCEQGQPIRVWALGPTGVVAAHATAPFIEGEDDLYRFDLEDGRSVTVTARHRFLTPSGWRHAGLLGIGSVLAASAPSFRPTSVDAGFPAPEASRCWCALPASPADAGRWTGTEPGSMGRCSPCLRRGDEPPLLGRGSDLAVLPLPVGVQRRSQAGWRVGGPDDGSSRNPGSSSVRHSSWRSSQAVISAAGVLSRAASSRATRRSSSNRDRLPSLPSSGLLLPIRGCDPAVDRAEDVPSLGSSPFSMPPLETLTYSTLRAVTKVGRARFYDLQVPGYENYLANGIWHHNSCKSFLSLAFALAVRTGCKVGPFEPSEQMAVLTLDWETTEDEQAERLHRLCAGLGLSNVPQFHYRPMWRSLADDQASVRAEVGRLGVGLVLVDSIAPAMGGEVTSEFAVPFFNALRSLGPGVSRLVVSHISKATAQQATGSGDPFGSVFVRNLARAAWAVKATPDGDGLAVEAGLFHTKANRGPLRKPVGVRLSFDDPAGPVTLRAVDVLDNAELVAHASLGDRIYAALREGHLSTDDLVERTGATKASVLRTLHRRRDEFVLLSGGQGRGNVATWGLCSYQEGA